jgi:single-strand DNA-binding protein
MIAADKLKITMNICIIKGHTTRDVEIRYLPNGTAIGSFGVAVNRKWKSESGEQKEEVSFFDVDAWGKMAETIAQWFRKGSPILITGRLKQETWDDKQTGQKRSKVKIVLDHFEFCGETRGAGTGGQNAPADNQSGASSRFGGQPHSTAANSATVAGDGPPESDGDFVPF